MSKLFITLMFIINFDLLASNSHKQALPHRPHHVIHKDHAPQITSQKNSCDQCAETTNRIICCPLRCLMFIYEIYKIPY